MKAVMVSQTGFEIIATFMVLGIAAVAVCALALWWTNR